MYMFRKKEFFFTSKITSEAERRGGSNCEAITISPERSEDLSFVTT